MCGISSRKIIKHTLGLKCYHSDSNFNFFMDFAQTFLYSYTTHPFMINDDHQTCPKKTWQMKSLK